MPNPRAPELIGTEECFNFAANHWLLDVNYFCASATIIFVHG